MLICPICKSDILKTEKIYKCENNHCFDISKAGHSNFLTSSKSGDSIGDNKEMVVARTNFLNNDYYKKLADFLYELIDKKGNYLDCGCGQGYYTQKISSNPLILDSFGTDISKNAVMYASKQDKKTKYFVSSVFDLPIKENSIDFLTSLFAPSAHDEFLRVLKKDGIAIIVTPGTEHLFELKQKIYENPYKNEEDKHDFSAFQKITRHKLKYKVCINENEDIKQLFYMTPYSFKTSKEDILKLDSLKNLEVTLDFSINMLQK